MRLLNGHKRREVKRKSAARSVVVYLAVLFAAVVALILMSYFREHNTSAGEMSLNYRDLDITQAFI